MYEFPATGDPLDDNLQQVGLPSIAAQTPISATGLREAYTMLSELNPDLALPDMGSEKPQVVDCKVPSFVSLLKSEMHVLLMHAEPHAPVWGQHMAQLSELVHSESFVGGPDNLEELISDTKFGEFIVWFRENLSGAADYDKLDGLQATYREKQPTNTIVSASSAVKVAAADRQ